MKVPTCWQTEFKNDSGIYFSSRFCYAFNISKLPMSKKLIYCLIVVFTGYLTFICTGVLASGINFQSATLTTGENQLAQVSGVNGVKYLFDDQDLQQKFITTIGPGATYQINNNNKSLAFIDFAPESQGELSSHSLTTQGSATTEQTAAVFNREYSSFMGIADPDRDLAAVKKNIDELGLTHIYFQQKYQDIPILGAQTALHFNSSDLVTSFSGKTVPNINLDVNPAISSNDAISRAFDLLTQDKGAITDQSKLTTSVELNIYNPGILNNTADNHVYLTWKVSFERFPDISVSYLLDAHTNNLLLTLTDIRNINRTVYDCSYGGGNCYLDTLLDGYTYGRSEGMPDRGTPPGMKYPDTDTAYIQTGVVHDFYHDIFGRNGANNQGGTGDGISDSFYSAPLANTKIHTFMNVVDTGATKLCPNAFFYLGSINFCQGFVALDIVGHEYTHAVSANSVPGGITYLGQSGAIDEAFSDVFGIGIEYTATGTNDSTHGTNAWLIGESVALADAGGTNITRSQSNPSDYNYGGVPYPERMYDTGYFCGANTEADDWGGVHENLSVFTYATYLMTMGGTFNGCTIPGMSGASEAVKRTKMEHIVYQAQTNHMLTASSFEDLYNFMNTSCDELVGQYGITSNDCLQVKGAMQATEMDQPGKCSGIARVAPLCETAIPTPTPTVTPTVTPTATPTVTPTPDASTTPTPTLTPGPSSTPTPTPDVSGTPEPSVTVTVTVTPTMTPEVTPTEAPITVTTITGLQIASDNTAQVEMIFIPDGGGNQTKDSGQSSSNGSLHMNTSLSATGQYDVYIKPQYHLSKHTQLNIAIGDNTINDQGDYVAGDFNNDDAVNSVDYGLFTANYGQSGIGDINTDGIVNSIDFAIFRYNYGYTGIYFNNFQTGWIW